MKRSFKHQKYTCPRLKNQVMITVEYVHPEPGETAAVGYDCDSDRACDIGADDDNGSYTWDRSLCPAVECVK